MAENFQQGAGKHVVNVMVVGAGQGGSKLIAALGTLPEVHIVQVVDVDLTAPGILLARQRGIPVGQDYREALTTIQEPLDVVLEVTGQPLVYEDLVQLTTTPTLVIAGTVLRFFVWLIEDQLQLIDRLSHQQRELELVLNATHDGMMGIRSDGTVTLFNRAAERLLGMTQAQVLGKRVDDVVPNSRLTRVVRTGQAELNQLQQVNGTEIVTNRVPVEDDDGRRIGAIAVFRDVTELHQMAAELTNLREVQTLLEAIIQSTQDAISVVDQEGRGLLINPAYTRLTGLPADEVLGKPANVDIAEGDSMHMRVLQTGQPVRNVQMKVGPGRREVIVNAAPILVGGQLRGSVAVIHDISEIKQLTEELERARTLIRTMHAKYTFDDVVGHSPAMVMAMDHARRAARTPATVLLRGESGTGKELFAHAIHNASDRCYQSFVRVNCAALSESLLESELFGYEEGAFTGAKRGGKRGLFEEASGGTLFLDEVGEMTQSTQVKLLRALQEREIVRVGGAIAIPIDVRLIAATHVNLEQAVASGRFREDLYYRLNVIPIVIPPLRYRREDIRDIAVHIIYRHNQSYGRNVERISAPAVEVLKGYPWPGNVRELENAIGRAMIHMGYGDNVLEAHHVPVLHGATGLAHPVVLDVVGVERLDVATRRAEQAAIEQALRATGGNKTEAAQRLGISLRSLYYKMGRDEGPTGGTQ